MNQPVILLIYFDIITRTILCMTAAAPLAMPLRSSKEFEMIYNMVRTDGIFMLKHNDLELQHNLGKGNFGSVIRGTYRLRGKVIDVAVKVLKANDMAAEVRVDFFAGWKTWKCQEKNLVREICSLLACFKFGATSMFNRLFQLYIAILSVKSLL